MSYEYSRSGNISGRPAEKLYDCVLAKIRAVPKGGRICELGCGNGYFSGLLASAGYAVTGIDASASGIDIARREYGERIQFLVSSIDGGLPDSLSAESFDAVVSIDVVEHFYRPSALLESANRLLAKNGTLLLSTPYHGYLKNLAIALAGKMSSHMSPLWDGGHIKFFDVHTLGALLRDAGFEKPEFSFTGRFPFLWKSMLAVTSKRRAL
jgi:2-polyprenyl-3-methyl-5-hydroxy-6-metoxy-1,4-benzoquinol methylase